MFLLLLIQLLDLPLPKAPQEEHFCSLFMSESESDIKFKVKDEMIPAHKKVLVQKSQYFANLFNNSSNQTVIEVDGRKDKTFKSK